MSWHTVAACEPTRKSSAMHWAAKLVAEREWEHICTLQQPVSPGTQARIRLPSNAVHGKQLLSPGTQACIRLQQPLKRCTWQAAAVAGSSRLGVLPQLRHLIRRALTHAAVPHRAHAIVWPERAVAVQRHLPYGNMDWT